MNAEDSATLPLDSVQSGARLAAAVLGADGQVLMTAGSILTEAALEKLTHHGVVAVVIAPQRDEAELNAAREALRLRLKHLFRKCEMESENGSAQMLFKAVLAYRLDALR
jgi:hypothetical protein